MGKFKFVYVSDDFNKDVKLVGILIGGVSVMSTMVFSRNYPNYEAFRRGLEIYSYRLRLMTEHEMRLVRQNLNEINKMLVEVGAHFTVPKSGACWVRDEKKYCAKAIDFATGKPVDAEEAWGLYVYL